MTFFFSLPFQDGLKNEVTKADALTDDYHWVRGLIVERALGDLCELENLFDERGFLFTCRYFSLPVCLVAEPAM